ncbi:MAG: prolipoprotein diacylglyceryl transferase [Pirellulales bacterium]|nr:prolipoprotein diacylglyceryl transferase [Pirellulales bacterium]
MLQTLFYIPNEIGGVPVFGFGLLLALWAIGSVVLLAWLGWRQGWNADTWGYVPILLLIAAAIGFVLPRLTEPEGLPIRGYGVMLLVALVAGTGMAAYRGRRLGIDPELIFAMAFWLFVPGILGARLFYVVEYWRDFSRPTIGGTLIEILKVTEGGLVVYGSLVGGFLGLVAFLAKHRLPMLAMFDLLAPSVVLGMAIGRLGCMLNGCCFGGVCDLPWAVRFPAESPPHVHQVQHGETFLYGLKIQGPPEAPPVITAVQPGSPAEEHGLKAGQTITAINARAVQTVEDAQWALLKAHRHASQLSVATQGARKSAVWPITPPPPTSEPVHPTQLYSALDSLLLCLFLIAYHPFRRRDGELFALLLTLYPITRFLLEIIRTDEASVFGTGLSISQNVSLIVLAAAVGVWIYVLRQPLGTVFPAYQPDGT